MARMSREAKARASVCFDSGPPSGMACLASATIAFLEISVLVANASMGRQRKMASRGHGAGAAETRPIARRDPPDRPRLTDPHQSADNPPTASGTEWRLSDSAIYARA